MDAYPTSGNRGFADGPTPEEVALVNRHKGVIRDRLVALYRVPLSRLPSLVKMNRERMAERILEMYRESHLAPLREILTTYMRNGVTLGGQVGLRDLGLPGTFALNNIGIRSNLEQYVNRMVDTDGERSITRTTANEVAAFVAAATEAQEEENPAALIALLLAAYITARADTRAFLIASHEGVAATRYGMVSAYVRNGISFLIYNLNRRPGQSQNCGCDRHNGKVYPAAAIPPDAQLPRHIGCQCSYTPYFAGWTKPAVTWTGE